MRLLIFSLKYSQGAEEVNQALLGIDSMQTMVASPTAISISMNDLALCEGAYFTLIPAVLIVGIRAFSGRYLEQHRRQKEVTEALLAS